MMCALPCFITQVTSEVLNIISFSTTTTTTTGHPAQLVAARAWEDSLVEYAVMELPSFAMTVFMFPTHLWVHLLHFCFHGYDGAAGHSGFGGVPGFLGYMFDGEYHYHHHSRLTVNYAELEFLDLWAGTHHTQKKVRMAF
jgi:hypothetical protein